MAISPARIAGFDILLRIERQHAHAGELLHSARLEPLSQADRALVTEIVMGVQRWRSRLDEAIALASQRPLEKLDSEVLTALRLGAYQLRYLSRIPAHAAINDTVELVKRAHKRSAAPFVNAVLRKIATTDFEPAALAEWTPATLARELAHPQWLVERWVAEYGLQRAHLICQQDQRIPDTDVRIDDSEIENELRGEGIELAPGALVHSARIVVAGDITRTRAYRGSSRVYSG